MDPIRRDVFVVAESLGALVNVPTSCSFLGETFLEAKGRSEALYCCGGTFRGIPSRSGGTYRCGIRLQKLRLPKALSSGALWCSVLVRCGIVYDVPSCCSPRYTLVV